MWHNDLVPTAQTTFYADLHVHSKHSRATSKHSDLEHLAYWAARKGIAVVGTGDFTHPAWRSELRDKLVPAEPGLFRLRGDLERAVHARLNMPIGALPRFLLSVEISTIYKKGDKVRKVHHLVYAPDLDTVDRMVARLARIGNLYSDGRPILGLDSRHLLEIVLDAGEHAYLVPAHVWTPWFAVLGSKSGFDEVADCYGDLAGHVFAIETGLSSDPPMNWRLSSLDRYTLMSSSDAHSPAKLGREACVFATEVDYFAMRRALETRQGYGGTIEFFPEEGKYHLDGHRKCGVVLEPAETQALDGRCPVCGKGLTVGVSHRVQELADRPCGFEPDGMPGFRSLVPLPEVIAEILGTGAGSKAVDRAYESVLANLGPELYILDHAPVEELRRQGNNQMLGQVSGQLAEAVARMRAGQVIRQAGYDGEYGVIRLFEDSELRRGKAVSLALALPEPAGPTSTGRTTGRTTGQTTGARARGRGTDGGGVPAPSGDAGDAASDLDEGDPPGDHGGDRSAAQASHARAERAGLGDLAEPGDLAELGDLAAPGDRAEPGGLAEPGDLAEPGGLAEPGDDQPVGAFLGALDPEQRRAAACTEGPLLIIAGPGTGKTRTLTHRIAHLVADRGVAPESCLAITFTNRAAEEMRERLDALLPELGSRVLVQTFHALALRMLREHRQRAGLHRGFRVAAEAERIELLAAALDCTPRKARSVLARIARLERASQAAGTAPASPESAQERSLESSGDAELARAREVYRAALESASLLDFDELLARAVALLGEDDIRCAYAARFVHVSIDEYQDIDELQYRLVTLLTPAPGERHAAAAPGLPARSLCAIGDPDQAIYSFRGADVRFFLRFREDFDFGPGAREVQLTRNYRSTATIVDAALQAIAPSSLVADRVLQAVSAGGPHPGARADERDAPATPARISIIDAASERAEAETVVHTIERLVGGTSFFSLDSERVGHEGETDLSFADFAVLYRTAAQAAPLCEALARSGIPFQVRSHARLADDPRVQALVERMRAILTGCPPGPEDAPESSSTSTPEGSSAGTPEGSAAVMPDAGEPPLARALREAAAGLAAVALAEAAETAGAAEAAEIRDESPDSPGAPQLEVLVDMLQPLAARCGDLEQFLTELAMDTEIDLWDPRADRVSLLTLHAAKGLEFRVVFLIGCEDGILPMSWSTRADAVPEAPRERLAARPEGRPAAHSVERPAERPGSSVPSPAASSEDEERRLFFVGMTRAKERLYLLHARKRRWRGKPCELPLSPFVRIIEEHLLSRQTSRAPKHATRVPAPHEQLGLF
jgi:DNA helicase-2/ATP-dependent DNA helicase PcrA